MDIKARASRKLKEYLEKNKLSIRGLADRIEVSPHTLKKVIDCDNYTIDKLQEISEKIGVDLG